MAEDFSGNELTGGGEGTKLMRLPKKSIQSEYLVSVLLSIRDFDSIIKNLASTDDPRPRLMARQIVNRILDDEIRYKLIDAFDTKVKMINSDSQNINLRAIRIVEASQDAVGEVNSYLDEFFALHKGQAIGDV
jgi:hypothetical protein